MEIQRIFLDMDGVITDFVTPALEVHQALDKLKSWPAGQRSMSELLGISDKEFWKPINELGARFWEELPAYPWTSDLIAHLREIAPVVILTSPSLHPSCSAGKVNWLYRHLGKSFRDFIISPRKFLLARADAVLIDDHEKHADEFIDAGGHGLLFPQWWNRLHEVTDPVDYITQSLRRIIAEEEGNQDHSQEPVPAD